MDNDDTSQDITPELKENWSKICDTVNNLIEEKIRLDPTIGRGYGYVMSGAILACKMAIEIDKATEFGEYISKWSKEQEQIATDSDSARN